MSESSNTTDQTAIQQQLELLATHRERLAILLAQYAHFGAHTAPHILMEIRETQAALHPIKAWLRAAGLLVADQLNDDLQDAITVGHQHEPADALAQLATLPLDTIPEVAPLPPGSLMPLRHNPLFVGRVDELYSLAAALKDGTTTVIAATTGIGGIGKSQLASEFAHRYGRYFPGGVFWLNCSEPANLPIEIAACGGVGALNLPGFDSLKLSDQIARVRQEWQSTLPRLLIFDNCGDITLLVEYAPVSGGSRVLVTSRTPLWDAALEVRALPLGVLSRTESITLLRKFRPDVLPDNADLGKIAYELGDLPLALHLAGSFLQSYRDMRYGTPAAYLAQLRQGTPLRHPSLAIEEGAYSPTRHALHIARTFDLSYERLDIADPIDRLARALLTRAAYFAWGEPIPHDLLLATLELNTDDLGALLAAEKGLARLVTLGLLERGSEGAVRLHRLLAQFTRDVAADEQARAAVEQALISEAYRLNTAGYPAPLVAMQSHLRDVADAAQSRSDEQAATLSSNLGYHLRMIGDLAGAQPYYQRALEINERVLGAEHPDTATSLNNLGYLLQAQGDLMGARLYYQRALEINERVSGAEHPDTALSLNNLGYLLYALSDLAGAQPYIERALEINERVLGAEHPDTARSLNNLGGLMLEQGNLTDAQPYLQRALEINERVLGTDHPITAQSLSNLGRLLQAMGNLADARPFIERAIAISERSLGPSHPQTIKIQGYLKALDSTQHPPQPEL
jgi:tetratricopeptide (TPR) repeat protein